MPQIIFLSLLIVFTSIFINNLPAPAVTITGVDFVGQATLPTAFSFQKTEVGGLSGITYDADNNVYYAISDDRSQKAPARFYTLKINLKEGSLQEGSVEVVGVTTLLNTNGKSFATASIDSEGIALTSKGTVFISSEGDAGKLINPFIKEFSLVSGTELKQLPVPSKFLPVKSGKIGIRNNLAFESLTVTPSQKYLFTATENALIQDGAAAKPKTSSPCRILQYNLLTNTLQKEFLYLTEPVTPLFNFANSFSTGLVDLLALDDQGHFLSLERSFTGVSFSIALFAVSLEEADNIRDLNSLSAVDLNTIKPVKKHLLLNLNTLDVALDNIEGLTFGPRLADGQRSLILVSDNNFNSVQRTQLLAFRLRSELPLHSTLRRLWRVFIS